VRTLADLQNITSAWVHLTRDASWRPPRIAGKLLRRRHGRVCQNIAAMSLRLPAGLYMWKATTPDDERLIGLHRVVSGRLRESR